MSAAHRFRESTAKRLAYGYIVIWLALVAGGIFVPLLLAVAAIAGFGAGLFMGRLTEARETRKGTGILLGE